MVYRPAQVYNGSGWDDIGDKRIGAENGDIPQASVTDLTSDLASKPTKTSDTVAPTSPADGDLWFDENTTPPTAKFWDGSAWQPFSSGAAPLTAADISGTTGTVSSATSGGYTTYVWTTSGSITFSKAGVISNVLCVGGGGGGGNGSGANLAGGGGGAGGLLNAEDVLVTDDTLTLTVTVGAGGAGAVSINADPGNPSALGAYLQGVGGGKGGSTSATQRRWGGAGGSGGGGSSDTTQGYGPAIAGSQGNRGGGGSGATGRAGGGGGASAVGGDADGSGAGDGGAGVDLSATYGSIGGASGVFAGGGGGSAESGTQGAGGSGGGGAGVNGAGTNGVANTGGGGGGAANPSSGGSGGSGIVAIRVVA